MEKIVNKIKAWHVYSVLLLAIIGFFALIGLLLGIIEFNEWVLTKLNLIP